VIFCDGLDLFEGQDIDDGADRCVFFGDYVLTFDIRHLHLPVAHTSISRLRYLVQDLKELVFCQAGLSYDCSKESSAYFFPFMDRNDGHSSIGVLEDDVTASLSDRFKTYMLEGPDDRSTVSSPQLRQIAPR